jgi:hypothetical protein
MLGERGLDPLETVGMPRTYCGIPAASGGRRSARVGRDAEERDLGSRACDELVVAVTRDVTSAEPTEVDTHEHALLGCRCSHFCDDHVQASTSPPSARGTT